MQEENASPGYVFVNNEGLYLRVHQRQTHIGLKPEIQWGPLLHADVFSTGNPQAALKMAGFRSLKPLKETRIRYVPVVTTYQIKTVN